MREDEDPINHWFVKVLMTVGFVFWLVNIIYLSLKEVGLLK